MNPYLLWLSRQDDPDSKRLYRHLMVWNSYFEFEETQKNQEKKALTKAL